jgi:hypothetical protein
MDLAFLCLRRQRSLLKHHNSPVFGDSRSVSASSKLSRDAASRQDNFFTRCWIHLVEPPSMAIFLLDLNERSIVSLSLFLQGQRRPKVYYDCAPLVVMSVIVY